VKGFPTRTATAAARRARSPARAREPDGRIDEARLLRQAPRPADRRK
jgi:hypothetical protein